jgi:hypothetical protein
LPSPRAAEMKSVLYIVDQVATIDVVTFFKEGAIAKKNLLLLEFQASHY